MSSVSKDNDSHQHLSSQVPAGDLIKVIAELKLEKGPQGKSWVLGKHRDKANT